MATYIDIVSGSIESKYQDDDISDRADEIIEDLVTYLKEQGYIVNIVYKIEND